MHRLSASDRDLVTFYTSAIGLQAQRYEPCGEGGTYDAHDAQIRLCQRGELVGVDRIRARLGVVAREHREHHETLRLIYGRGAGAIERGAKDGAVDVRPLVLELAPRWGHGSFVGIVHRVERATRAWDKRRRLGETLLEFLAREAEPKRKKESGTFFRQLVTDCEAIRTPALAAYDAVLKAERAARPRPRRAPHVIRRHDAIGELLSGRAA